MAINSGVCSVEGCDRDVVARGWCRRHYARWKRTGQLEARPWQRQETCTVEDCDRQAWSGGYCQMHRWRVRYKNDPGPAGSLQRGRLKPEQCEAEGCTRPPAKRTYCQMHYQRLRKTGKLGPAEPVKTAEHPRAPCSVDGCDRPRKGRLYCHLHTERLRRTGEVGPAQPATIRGVVKPTREGYRRIHVNGRRVLEHVYVKEQQLGRRLVDGENVHHKNGIKSDNDPDNLELWLVMQPTGQRVEDLMKYIAEYHADAMRALLAERG